MLIPLPVLVDIVVAAAAAAVTFDAVTSNCCSHVAQEWHRAVVAVECTQLSLARSLP